MNAVGIALALGFFLYRRRICRAERAAAAVEVAALLAEDR